MSWDKQIKRRCRKSQEFAAQQSSELPVWQRQTSQPMLCRRAVGHVFCPFSLPKSKTSRCVGPFMSKTKRCRIHVFFTCFPSDSGCKNLALVQIMELLGVIFVTGIQNTAVAQKLKDPQSWLKNQIHDVWGEP